ncbi:flagellar filament capping protein FliD [Proteiniclasticum ruminis]|uniref:Flagellar hook-associated protein 2 n=1 Tax=Proteiniclasticum ruminis TaxID=398199 RepID=A0A1G8I0D3_9CLOT|nr:flagellar filament capping protein FliD [Proteiniclasticum ruminis]SDI12368.1 flagellar hook-associated protein 2 [Proteiniclasticum ruminis]
MSINFMGSYSGIDQTMIDQLMAVEKRPLVQMSERKTTMETQKNAWNDVRTRLNNLFEKIKVLQNSDTFSSMKATGGESATMTTSKNSPEGVYEISVQQLATKTSVIGGKIVEASSDSTKALGLTGTFKLNTEGKDAKEIEIVETDTVRTIAEKINAVSKESGVRASIIDNRLVLNNLETGTKAIQIAEEADSTILNQLGLKDTSEVIEGKNAKFKVNGVSVEKESNSVKDVVEYTTINLTKAHAAGSSDTITISKDTSKVEEAVKGFVDQYNSTMTFISDQLKAGSPDDGGDKRGTLASDGSLMRLQSTLRTMVTSSLSNENTAIKDLSQLGVSTVDRFGQLTFDASKLKEKLEEDPVQVQNFFMSKNSEGKDIGFVPKINSYIDSFSSSTGIIKGKTDSFERSIKEVNKQVDAFALRMERKEKYYISMFSKLDTAMMEAESQMGWLTSQISALSASSGSKK